MLVSQTNPVRVELCLICVYNAFFCSNKFAHADAGNVSENALQYKGKMLTLSTELTSGDCSFAKKVDPFALPSCRSQQPSSML